MKLNEQPLINERSNRRRTRICLKDNDLIIGSWNIRTMIQSGKMAEIVDEVLRYGMELVALQEIRWKDSGELRKKDYSIYYSGGSKSGANGTGFYVSKRVRECVIFFQPVNDRICLLKVKGKFQNICILSVYAPTENNDDEERDTFYDDLSALCNKISKHDITLIIGDYNARIGKEDFTKPCAGSFSQHDATSENGIHLISFATEHNLWISSTSFRHKKIHKGTWKIPGRNKANQIDHVLVDKRHSSSVLDVKSCRGANCESDHYLLKIKIRQRISKLNSNSNYKRVKWNTDKLLNNEETRNSYQRELADKLQNQANPDWSNIMETIKDVATNTVGFKKNHDRSEWYDDECRKLVEIKNEAYRAYIDAKTDDARYDYEQKRKAAKRLIKRKKRDSLKEKITIMETNAHDSAAKFYRDIKTHTTPFQPRTNICLSETGDTLLQEDDILKRWQEYFCNLLNNDQSIAADPWPQVHTVENYTTTPNFIEIKDAIRKLKSCKASGEDSITAELIKFGGEALHLKLYNLITNIWESETIPTEWLGSLIFPVHKKGDKRNCTNYRGISLLNVAYKIFTNVLYERLNVVAEEIIGDYQCGFRKGKSTTDQCFALSQIFEKCQERGHDVYCLFIDFKQAFDSVKRERINDVFFGLGIPAKLIRLISATLEQTKAKILIQGKLSNEFDIKSGVKQGDALSTLIFNLMLHFAIREVDQGGTIFQKSTQICAYADDIAIVARDPRRLTEIFLRLNELTSNIGLYVNVDKTKYFIKSRSSRNVNNLCIGEYCFERVNQFKYLGVTFSSTEDSSYAIKERITSAYKCFYAHSKLFKSKLLTRSTKIRIYKTIVRPVLTYGCEVWSLKINDCRLLQCFERKIFRKIFGPVKNDDGTYRIRWNDELEGLAGHKTIVRYIKAQRLRWFGHVIRMPTDALNRKLLMADEHGTRTRGRPRIRWIEGVLKDLNVLRIQNYETLAKDRVAWRRIVEEALAHTGL